MTKVMYQGSTGSVRTTAAGGPGSFMQAGIDGAPHWRPFQADLLPYTSPYARGVANVSTALDFLVHQGDSVLQAIADLKSYTNALDMQNDGATEAIALRVEAFNRVLNEMQTKLTNGVHPKLTAGRTSNPALSVDDARQTVSLNLSKPGSYDDSLSNIGATSIQEAITRTVLKANEQATELKLLKVLQQQDADKILELQNRVQALVLEVSKLRNTGEEK